MTSIMKNIRYIIASLLFAGGVCVAEADDFQYLTIAQTDGETSFTVSTIQKITFDATNMVLHLTDGTTQSMPLSGLSRMFFSQTSAGVTAITPQSKIVFEGGILRANISSGEQLFIYNTKGEQVFTTNQSGSFPMGTLAKGVYIVRVGAETKKVVNK